MYSYLWGVVCLPLSHLNELLLFLAFGFCLEYKRKAEFHKLCDIVSVVLETMFIPFHFLFVVPFYCSDTNYYSPLSLPSVANPLEKRPGAPTGPELSKV